MDAIRLSHFGIIDITGCNPNVFLELGFMIALGKKFLLLRRNNDTTALPFDIQPYQHYTYKVRQRSIHVLQPTGEYEPVESVLADFIRQLDIEHDQIGAEWLAGAHGPRSPSRPCNSRCRSA